MRAIDCGIDIGTTNVKVVLADEEGRVLYTHSMSSPRVSDGTGVATDAMQLVSQLETLIIDGWAQVAGGVPLRSITAAGVGEDGIGLGRNLTPTGLSLPWFDRRATAEAEELRDRHHGLSPRAGIAIASDRTAAKWLWLHRHRRHELAEAEHWVALTDFPAVWWSGRTFMSSSLAPRTACFDVYDWTWIEPLLAAAHAPQLPDILGAGCIAGGVRGGALRDSGAASAKTIVAAGGHDHPIAASTIRRFDANGRVDSLGTANLVYGETVGFPAPRLDQNLAFSVPPSDGAGVACLGVMELSVALAAVQSDPAAFMAFLDHQRLPGSPPRSAAQLKATGGDNNTNIRRALERASFDAKRMLDAMRDAGVPDGPLYTTGGWSRSRGFVELRASIFNEAIHAVSDVELTALGAALYGAEAATGAAISLPRPFNVQRIEPVADWRAAYEAIADETVKHSD